MQTALYIFQIILGITCAYMTVNWIMSFTTTLIAYHNKTMSSIKATELLHRLKVNAFIVIILYTIFILLY